MPSLRALSVLTAVVLAWGATTSAHGGSAAPARTAAGDFAAADWGTSSIGAIDEHVFDLALDAASCAVRSGDATNPATLTVIDYSKPSTAKRLWVFDLHSRELLHEELVAHGQGSGDVIPTRFSNEPDTHSSSLGLFEIGRAHV